MDGVQATSPKACCPAQEPQALLCPWYGSVGLKQYLAQLCVMPLYTLLTLRCVVQMLGVSP